MLVPVKTKKMEAIARFLQALAERRQNPAVRSGRSAVEETGAAGHYRCGR